MSWKNGGLDNSLSNLSWGTLSKNNGEDRLRDGVSNDGKEMEELIEVIN